MSDYIDPRTEPWGYDTEEIWGWLKEVWMATVNTIWVPDTEANRIKEYQSITQFWKQKYRQQNGRAAYSECVFTDWLQSKYRCDHPDRRGCPPRRRKQRPCDPFDD